MSKIISLHSSRKIFIAALFFLAILPISSTYAEQNSTLNASKISEEKMKQNPIYIFLVQSGGELHNMKGQTLDVTNEFRKAMANDDFKTVVDYFHELDGRLYIDNPVTGKTYWLGFDHDAMKLFSLSQYNYKENYEFMVQLKYRSNQDFDVIKATIVDKTIYP